MGWGQEAGSQKILVQPLFNCTSSSEELEISIGSQVVDI